MKIKVKLRKARGQVPPSRLKVGSMITVLEEPKQWSSALSGRSPIEGRLKYPFTGRLNKVEFHKGDHWAANIGGYGFSLSNIEYIVSEDERI